MASLDFKAFDADNHYYEAEDAFIRHVDPKMHKRCMQWAEINGRKRLLVGGRVNRFIPNPTFDPVARPGCLDDYFRGRVAKDDIVAAFGELVPIPDEYRDRDKRLQVMDQQNLESCFLFPTLGVGMESSLDHDTEAVLTAFAAFNKWIHEDWGFSLQEPHLRCRVRHARRRRLGSRPARLDDRTGRACGQHAPLVGARWQGWTSFARRPGP